MGSELFTVSTAMTIYYFSLLLIQVILLYTKLESWAEAKVALFHIMAMVMEIFLTHPAIASWQYPQPAIFKILTVPLFAGFYVFGCRQFLHVPYAYTKSHLKNCRALAICWLWQYCPTSTS